MKALLFSTLAAAALLLTLSACDDGKIYPENNILTTEGQTVTVSCRLDGVQPWASSADYHLAIAAFADDGSRYATVARNITSTPADDRLILTGVGAEASTVEICILDRLRKRVASIASFPLAGAAVDGDTIRFAADAPIDVSPLAVVQSSIFTPTCSACHGGGSRPAAQLSLLAGEARKDLINVPSTVVPGSTRVVPGDPDASLLYRALTSQLTAGWVYDHSVEVVDPDMQSILRLWISTEE